MKLSGKGTPFRMMLIIWSWDTVRFMGLYQVLLSFGIDPWIFFFLDMSTVPTYVLGWKTLLSSLPHRQAGWGRLFAWGIIAAVSSSAPYLYACLEGGRSLPLIVRLMVGLAIALPFFNVLRNLFPLRHTPESYSAEKKISP